MDKKLDYFSIIFTLVILYLSFLLVKPFIGAILSALIMSYLLYPLYKMIYNKVKNKDISIIFMLLIIILVILIPLSLIIYSLVDDMAWFLSFLRNFDLNSVPYLTPEMVFVIKDYVIGASQSITSSLLKLLSSLGNVIDKVFNILIFLFATILFLKNGPDLIKKFKITIPIDETQKETLIAEFTSVVSGLIYSVVFTSIIGGVVGGLLFFLFGIPNPLLWGFMIALLSPVPLIGNFPVWLGGMLYLILLGQPILGVLFIILGIAVEQFQNLFGAKIMGDKSKINGFLVLMGIISGVKVFGPIGIILGPLIFSLLITIIRLQTKNYKEKFKL